MTSASTHGVVELAATIAASPLELWRALTDPAVAVTWLGYHLESTWVPGAPLALVGALQGRPYRESGELLACDPPSLLRYDHWSRLWRIPDLPGNRAVMTITLAPDGDATRITTRQTLPPVEALVEHARFFWTVALGQLRRRHP